MPRRSSLATVSVAAIERVPPEADTVNTPLVGTIVRGYFTPGEKLASTSTYMYVPATGVEPAGGRQRSAGTGRTGPDAVPPEVCGVLLTVVSLQLATNSKNTRRRAARGA